MRARGPGRGRPCGGERERHRAYTSRMGQAIMTKGQFRILLVLTVVAGFLGGAACNLTFRGTPAVGQAQEEVRAKSFVLVDEARAPRAALTIQADGSPCLSLSDAAGNPRAALSVLADGRPGLGLSDAAGKPRAVLGFKANGELGLWLADAKGKTRAVLTLLAGGSPGLTLGDAMARRFGRRRSDARRI